MDEQMVDGVVNEAKGKRFLLIIGVGVGLIIGGMGGYQVGRMNKPMYTVVQMVTPPPSKEQTSPSVKPSDEVEYPMTVPAGSDGYNLSVPGLFSGLSWSVDKDVSAYEDLDWRNEVSGKEGVLKLKGNKWKASKLIHSPTEHLKSDNQALAYYESELEKRGWTQAGITIRLGKYSLSLQDAAGPVGEVVSFYKISGGNIRVIYFSVMNNPPGNWTPGSDGPEVNYPYNRDYEVFVSDITPLWVDQPNYRGEYFDLSYPISWVRETSPEYVGKSMSDVERFFARVSVNTVFTVTFMSKDIEEIVDSDWVKTTVNGRGAYKQVINGRGEPIPVGNSLVNYVVKGNKGGVYLINFNGKRSEFPDELISQLLGEMSFKD